MLGEFPIDKIQNYFYSWYKDTNSPILLISNQVCELSFFSYQGKTFSVGKGFDACKPCSKCQKGEVVKETCIRRRDTKCTPEKDFNNSKQKPFLLVPTKSKPRTNGDTRIAKEEPSKSSSGSESFSTLSSKSLFINFFLDIGCFKKL